ncbi:hypothetical protein HPB48_004100 [Haemaphysalis longicornis]|uniref:AMP-binding enzyme C-terminal domain-containing protein n=1 Tax=Haemaphysalis longicornis TaxID=44386 RepID=A0A9J6FLF1_HAELO|nr:hypothetical protein HPB48_004100 [Haemaphysalis longicornis]
MQSIRIRGVLSCFRVHPQPSSFLGDTGYYSARGEVYVLDRIKDFVKCMDLQVAPAELEELLQDHADVAQAAVVGVPHSVCGEAPRAFIVLKAEARPRTSQEEETKQLEFVKYIESK